MKNAKIVDSQIQCVVNMLNEYGREGEEKLLPIESPKLPLQTSTHNWGTKPETPRTPHNVTQVDMDEDAAIALALQWQRNNWFIASSQHVLRGPCPMLQREAKSLPIWRREQTPPFWFQTWHLLWPRARPSQSFLSASRSISTPQAKTSSHKWPCPDKCGHVVCGATDPFARQTPHMQTFPTQLPGSVVSFLIPGDPVAAVSKA